MTKYSPDMKFGRLTLSAPVGKGVWTMKCDCGAVVNNRVCVVAKGVVRSCGCLHREVNKNSQRNLKHGYACNGKVERLHNVWRDILKRCYSTNVQSYKDYGGRGISVCAEWKNDYPAFRAWMLSQGYGDGLTVERIDNDGPYSPENCMLASRRQQARNRRTTRWVVIDGVKKSLAEWIEILKISRTVARGMLAKYGTLQLDLV